MGYGEMVRSVREGCSVGLKGGEAMVRWGSGAVGWLLLWV